MVIQCCHGCPLPFLSQFGLARYHGRQWRGLLFDWRTDCWHFQLLVSLYLMIFCLNVSMEFWVPGFHAWLNTAGCCVLFWLTLEPMQQNYCYRLSFISNSPLFMSTAVIIYNVLAMFRINLPTTLWLVSLWKIFFPNHKKTQSFIEITHPDCVLICVQDKSYESLSRRTGGGAELGSPYDQNIVVAG